MESRIRASVVCIHDGRILVFKGIDPFSHKVYWFLPGGKIEPHEQPWQCAERETLEETGYLIRVLKESEIVMHYRHWWDSVEYSCKTYFYKATLREAWHEPKPVADVDYNKGAAWLPLDEALEFFAYTTEIQQAVASLAH